jgi:hypothetical protein
MNCPRRAFPDDREIYLFAAELSPLRGEKPSGSGRIQSARAIPRSASSARWYPKTIAALGGHRLDTNTV